MMNIDAGVNALHDGKVTAGAANVFSRHGNVAAIDIYLRGETVGRGR